MSQQNEEEKKENEEITYDIIYRTDEVIVGVRVAKNVGEGEE